MLTAEKKRLQEEIATMPDEMVTSVVRYVEKLKASRVDYGAPRELLVRNKQELNRGLEKGFSDIRAGRTRPWHDVLADLRRRYS